MTYTDVWVGDLGEGAGLLDWEGAYTLGNTPRKALTPMFPPAGNREPWRILVNKIKAGELLGKQVDWGAWAANVTSQQVLDLIHQVYSGDAWYVSPSPMPHLLEKLAAVKTAVAALPADGRFALIADEF